MMVAVFLSARGLTWRGCPTISQIIASRGKQHQSCFAEKRIAYPRRYAFRAVSAAGSGLLDTLGDTVEQDDNFDFDRLMKHARLTHIAQELWQQVCQPGDIIVDATCGNGHDTLFLAKTVGKTGTVYAFDVQAIAIAATRDMLDRHIPAIDQPQVHLIHSSHTAMQDVVGSNLARLIVFNLGFLPGSDKSVVTEESSTVEAVQAACKVLKYGGLLSVLAYTRHDGGMEEYQAVQQLISKFSPSDWVSTQVQLLNRPTAPILLLAWKQYKA